MVIFGVLKKTKTDFFACTFHVWHKRLFLMCILFTDILKPSAVYLKVTLIQRNKNTTHTVEIKFYVPKT